MPRRIGQIPDRAIAGHVAVVYGYMHVLLVLSGCGLPMASHVIYESPPIQGETKAVVVDAGKGWQSSSIVLQKGDSVFFEADGTWSVAVGVWPHSGPAGYQGGAYAFPLVCPGEAIGVLCAKIGGGNGFGVGKQLFLASVPRDGLLEFVCNERAGDWWNNAGHMSVEIVIRRRDGPPVDAASLAATAPIPATSPPGPTSPVRQRWAVLVGVSDYRAGTGIPHLAFAAKDARDFAALLRRRGLPQDNVKMLLDREATKAAVEQALKTWVRKAGKDDVIILFWSGHGYPDPEDPSIAYFACHDSRLNDPASAIEMGEVRRWLERRGARNVVVIADTCHAGKVIRSANPKAISVGPSLEAMERARRIPPGMVFIVSAQADRKAYEDSSWTNGALTHVLLQALSGKADGYKGSGAKDGTVTFGEVRTYIQDRMPEETLKILGAALRPLIYVGTTDARINDLPLTKTK